MYRDVRRTTAVTQQTLVPWASMVSAKLRAQMWIALGPQHRLVGRKKTRGVRWCSHVDGGEGSCTVRTAGESHETNLLSMPKGPVGKGCARMAGQRRRSKGMVGGSDLIISLDHKQDGVCSN